MTIKQIRNNQRHGYHLVDPSPWPIVAAFSALMLTFGGVMYFHGYFGGNFLWKFGFLMILFVMVCWWKDIVREGTFEGQHTDIVQSGLRMGVFFFYCFRNYVFFCFFLGIFSFEF